MSSPPPSIQMMIHMDNPWLSPSINKHFSGRAGLEAQLKMGEEISLPSSSSPAAPSTGVLLSPNTSPYNLPLGRVLPAAPQLTATKAGIWGEGNLCNKVSWAVTHSGGMVFMEWPHQCQTSTRGRNQCVEGSNFGNFFKLMIMKVAIHF